MKIGVLALQGAFEEHIKSLEKLGADTFEIRQKKDFDTHADGIIIPGGESTVISKLLTELDMRETLLKIIAKGTPVFGTCAGLIMLSSHISDEKTNPLNCMDIKTKRNAYGRQLGSFAATGRFGTAEKIPMVFIRAPYIEQAGENVEILSVVDDKIVAARQGQFLVTAFHPELTDDLSVHKYFLEMVENAK